jgi:integrase
LHIQEREGRWVLADILGKNRRLRTAPVPSWAKHAVDLWSKAAGIATGPLFRPVNKADRLAGAALSAQSVFNIVRRYTGEVGVRLAPHDLRRSFARLAHRGHAPVEQIQLSLGHSSIVTTERYIGVQQDLANAPCDHLGIRMEE